MGYVRWINRVSESGVTLTLNSTSSFDSDLETDKWCVIELYENLWTMADLYACVYVLYASNMFDQLPRVQSVIFACKREIDNIYSTLCYLIQTCSLIKWTLLNEYYKEKKKFGKNNGISIYRKFLFFMNKEIV